MKYLNDDAWAKLPLADFRGRFFVETYIEKLSMDTPHFSQSRLMNLFSSCEETLIYIQEYQANEKNGGYILSALDEIDSCLSNDPIAKDMFTHTDEPRKQLFKKIRGGDFNSNQLNKLSVICRAILSRDEEYSTRLLDSLSSAIFDIADLTKKERLTSTIYSLTRLYTTHLLNRGYSPTYLYNRAEMFTRITNYSGRTFEEQFQIVTERLRSRTTSYEVYFAIRANKPSCLFSISNQSNFTFSRSLPENIQSSNREKLTRDFQPNVIANSSIEATDYVTASWRTKDKLDKLLDAVTALELNPNIQVSSHCLAISSNLGLTHQKTLNINLLLRFLSSEGGTYFSNSEASILHTFNKLNDQGREQLGRSLRYLRLARESISLEQKLLNLWISVESLFSDGESSILANIIEYVPQIYAVSSLSRRVRYLRDLLAQLKVPTTELIKTQIMGGAVRFDKNTTDSQIFEITRNEKAAIELFDSLNQKEHLKYKLLSTFKEMESNKSIIDRITSSEVDVTRQLRRIYFLRNKIAHTGHYSNIRPQLVTHLLDYLAVCYLAIAKSASKATENNSHSIGDLLAAYKMGADVVISRARSSSPIKNLEELTPTPII